MYCLSPGRPGDLRACAHQRHSCVRRSEISLSAYVAIASRKSCPMTIQSLLRAAKSSSGTPAKYRVIIIQGAAQIKNTRHATENGWQVESIVTKTTILHLLSSNSSGASIGQRSLPIWRFAYLLSDRDSVTAGTGYHILSGSVSNSDPQSSQTYASHRLKHIQIQAHAERGG